MAAHPGAVVLTEAQAFAIMQKNPELTDMLRPKDGRKPRIKAKKKYGNRYTSVDGITFHSAKEARRYSVLKAMLASDEISDLERQVKYSLDVNGVHICNYICDFRYKTKRGKEVVEDVKGYRTREYLLKLRLMYAVHGIEILES